VSDDLDHALNPTDLIASRDPDLRAPLRLVVLSGPPSDVGRSLLLRQGTYLVGKASDCDLVLTGRGVSRHHLRLEVLESGIRVEDLDTKNGTFFQGARLREARLSAGAVLVVAETELKLTLPTETPRVLPSTSERFGSLVGRSLPMREAFGLLERIAADDGTVLIEGETGTGKELCAESIHAQSGRAGRPFVVCDFAGLSRALIESELFGHLRGAFTGADQDRVGAFQQAHGGTLFLDEIGELELDLQPRLLRLLERGEVKRVGATQYEKVDVRVIAATNRDLREEIRAGRFREDLYYRLAVLRVRLPPLRERREDLPLLVERLVDSLVGPRSVPLSPEAAAVLGEYEWPGNVRELRNVVTSALSLHPEAERLDPSMLALASEPPAPQPADASAKPDVALPDAFAEGDFRRAKERLIASWERAYLQELLRRAEGNVARAARRSGIDRPYLHRLLKKHGLGGQGG
jgi:DNA-binding NtrC family response regulator